VEGDHIACFMENNIRFFELFWAALRCGLYITTINSHLKNDEAGYILDNCDAQVLIASYHCQEAAKTLPAYSTTCRSYLMFDGVAEGYQSYEQAIARYSTDPLGAQPEGAFMLYSSGTTGRPKGIALPLPGRELGSGDVPVGAAQRLVWGFDPETVYILPAPLYHGAASAFAVCTIANGGTVVFMPKFDALEALHAMERYSVTHSQWVPTMFTRMLDLPEAQRKSIDLSAHKVAIHAAAPCSVTLKQKMFNWWGPIIHEYYSGTEGSGIVLSEPEDWLKYPGTVGKSIFGEIRVCDDNGKHLPTGEIGTIYFAQPEQTYQYYKEKGKTRSAQHPVHATWTTLGDVGYTNEDGYLFLTDRTSFMIISGGVNIYPQEIEDRLMEHPNVFDVAVIGVPNMEMG